MQRMASDLEGRAMTTRNDSKIAIIIKGASSDARLWERCEVSEVSEG